MQYFVGLDGAAREQKRMTAFMARHSYTGRRTAVELVQRLRSAPASATGELEAEAKSECVRALVAVLLQLVAQLATLSATIEHAVDAHPDGKIVTPLFRSGRICVAQLLTEIGDDRGRFVFADHLAAERGAAPVTRESGKHRAVTFRWACNMRLRQALGETPIADLSAVLRHVAASDRAVVRTYSPEAADQVERAASGIVLNLAEGGRRHGRDPRRFWDMAHGSAGEIRGALDLADAWGWQVDSVRARALLDRELGLLWGLTRRSRHTDAPSSPASRPRSDADAEPTRR
jgi:four helix bundle protein